MMIRTQIQLTEKQAEKLEAMAAVHRMSKAEVVRMAVDRLFTVEAPLSRREQMARAQEVFGKYSSAEPANVSENHDEYLEEIYGTW